MNDKAATFTPFLEFHSRWQDRWKEATGNFVPEGMTRKTCSWYPADKRRQLKEQAPK